MLQARNLSSSINHPATTKQTHTHKRERKKKKKPSTPSIPFNCSNSFWHKIWNWGSMNHVIERKIRGENMIKGIEQHFRHKICFWETFWKAKWSNWKETKGEFYKVVFHQLEVLVQWSNRSLNLILNFLPSTHSQKEIVQTKGLERRQIT